MCMIASYCFMLGSPIWTRAMPLYSRFNIAFACVYLVCTNFYLLAQACKLEKAALKVRVEKYSKLPMEYRKASSSTTCVICLEDFLEDDRICVLPCKHVFHTDCAKRWLTRELRCPLHCDVSGTASSADNFTAVAGDAPTVVQIMVGGGPSLPRTPVEDVWALEAMEECRTEENEEPAHLPGSIS